jgi:hypothetical protein
MQETTGMENKGGVRMNEGSAAVCWRRPASAGTHFYRPSVDFYLFKIFNVPICKAHRKVLGPVSKNLFCYSFEIGVDRQVLIRKDFLRSFYFPIFTKST